MKIIKAHETQKRQMKEEDAHEESLTKEKMKEFWLS